VSCRTCKWTDEELWWVPKPLVVLTTAPHWARGSPLPATSLLFRAACDERVHLPLAVHMASTQSTPPVHWYPDRTTRPTASPRNPRPAESGPRFPVPGRIGDSLFPGQIGNRGFPPRFRVPAENRESGGSVSRFPSDVRALTVTAVDSEYTQRLSCQCSQRQHAAPIQGLLKTEHWHAASDEHQPQWTRNILSREYHASPSALTGSMRLLFRVREREHAAVICLPRLRKLTSSGSRNVFRQWILVVDVPWHQSLGRHRPKSPSHSPPSPCPSRPPSAGPDSFKVKQLRSVGGGLNRHFKDSRQHPAQDRTCCTHTDGYPRFPDLRPIGTPIPDSRPNREMGDFPIPDSGRVGNRGFPPRFPAKSGIGGTGIGDFWV
jgi:hypothetical protein